MKPIQSIKIWMVLLPAAGLLLAVIGADAFAVARVRHSSEVLQETLAKIQTAEETKTQVDQLAKEWEELEPEVKKAEEFFFSESDLAEFLKDVENLATVSSVALTSQVSAPADSGAQGAREFSFVFTISGGFGGVTSFLEKIENFPVLLRLEHVTFTSQSQEGDAVRAVISAKVPVHP